MATLITTKGPNPGRCFSLNGETTVIGRQPDAGVYLESLAVSRHHARVLCERGRYFVEDLGSSNGTFLNGTRVTGRVPLTESDTLQVGPYEFNLQLEDDGGTDPHQVIRARVDAAISNQTLFSQNPAHKLQVMLEIAQSLGHTLDIDPLLGRLLEHLLRLFPQADRGMVLLCERDRVHVRAQRLRQGGTGDFPYSRTLVRRALDEGVALLSEDVGHDQKIVLSATMMSLNLRSFLCVPLIGWNNRRLGVIQLDCLRAGHAFRPEDLELLTTIGLQVSVVLQNAAYHAERIREERLRQELLLAREIQQQFLPTEFSSLPGIEIFAQVNPAREVSGDLYDFFKLPDGRLFFFLGDVSGKGMPAALFMIAVRTLSRHLGPHARGPSEFLDRLNEALTEDNPTNLYVTLICGMYDPRDNSVLLASGGHPPALLRHDDGKVEELKIKPGILIGSAPLPMRVKDTPLTLAPGETLIFYTDGFTEGFGPDRTMFGLERLCEVLGGERTALSLAESYEAASAAVSKFTGSSELQDDQTLLLLRRTA
jgi:serine phosphatase RsbU (regulator of sigma subunit)